MTRVPEMELRHRAVPIVGTFNFRDVGGYEASGASTRWGQLFRSDALHNLDEAARTMLAELGVRTVVDLRTDAERSNYPDALPEGGPTVIACPILDATAVDPVPTSLAEVYDRIVDDRGPAVVTAIRAIAAPGALPAVLHCTAGKDRTGVVTALLLSSLGVPDDVVASDFAATELFLTDEFLAVLAQGTTLSIDSPMLRADAALMLDLLARVRAEYGDARSYLLAQGLTGDEHDELRRQLLGPDGR